MQPPRPSSVYIDKCARSALTVKNGRQLIILDLNGTLISTKTRNNSRRPHLDCLKKYLFEQFDVMVYSSAMRHNVSRYVDNTFSGKQKTQLKGVLAREDMDMSKKDFASKLTTYKNLNLIWSGNLSYDQSNTILIDDSKEKASYQPYNLLQLSTWNNSEKDSMLIALIGVLDEIKKVENVSHYLSTFKHVKCVDVHADTTTPWFDIPHVYAYWLTKGEARLNIDGVLDNMASLSVSEA